MLNTSSDIGPSSLRFVMPRFGRYFPEYTNYKEIVQKHQIEV